MANYVTVDIVWPCGHRSNTECDSTTSGTMRCSSCKKMYHFKLEEHVLTQAIKNSKFVCALGI